MRTEKEMKEIILSVAQNDERIRLVTLEGSRTNPAAKKDRFQDFDLSYFVTEMNPFVQEESWLEIFGERIFMQKPEAMTLFPPELGNWFSYLMLFEDGHRIDLTLVPLEELNDYLSKSDGLLEVLLDKDGLIQELPTPTDSFYHIKRPTAKYYEDCCNEFWWIATYVVKGICRQEFIYAAEFLNQHLRQELLRMLSWKVGIETNFSVSVGKNYKNLEKYVAEDVWNELKQTYEMSTYRHLWKALFTCMRLFRVSSRDVAKQLGFTYPKEYDKNISGYIEDLYKECYE